MPNPEKPAAFAREEIVLASASAVRARLLRAAGVRLLVDPAHVDETELRASFLAEGMGAREIADALAALKAERISHRHAGLLVLGADQVLDCGGRLFEKPHDMAEARAQLRALSGRSHTLVSAVAAAREGAVIWRHVDTAKLLMRTLSPEFIDGYLAAAGAGVLSSVGAYALEDLGAQLFSRLEGDYFTVLGLPLLPLLEFLRTHGILQA